MNGKSRSSFTTLAQIKSLEERSAAERLTTARERLDVERLKLTTVQRYLLEYSDPGSTVDTHTRLIADRHRFRLELERSVEAQAVAVERARVQAEAAREHWASVRAEREAMQKLVDRRESEEARRLQQADQRQTDEQSLQRAGKGDDSTAV